MSIEEWLSISSSFSDVNDNIPYTFSVIGESMLPLVRSRIDDITVIPIADRKLEAGDIILFRYPECEMKYMLHRIVSISDYGQSLITMGDGNPGPDLPIKLQDVVGYAVNIKRGRLKINPNSRISRLLNRIWMSLGKNRRVLLLLIKKAGSIVHGQ